MQNLVLLQAVSCFFLTGLIWTVQLVHYPSFKWVERDGFSDFSSFHSARISFIVIPVMLLELVTSGFLLFTQSPLLISKYLLIANFMGVVLIWGVTFLLSVPCHSRLSLGFCEMTISKLVKTNWLRTFLWSLRTVIWFTVLSGSIIV